MAKDISSIPPHSDCQSTTTNCLACLQNRAAAAALLRVIWGVNFLLKPIHEEIAVCPLPLVQGLRHRDDPHLMALKCEHVKLASVEMVASQTALVHK
ncbi:hypothetical protein DPMN_163550 [Dreissena polymorpha]|uniref:Uncharacterized protein n=1 Tax=Dreissena polymorpha TaxID=45954 RepID=A0A9D4EWV7_DREPO|nr:hypothetical protein DPMN_163550 [Dreissena polymorpha]